jgi:hypothetical protein
MRLVAFSSILSVPYASSCLSKYSATTENRLANNSAYAHVPRLAPTYLSHFGKLQPAVVYQADDERARAPLKGARYILAPTTTSGQRQLALESGAAQPKRLNCVLVPAGKSAIIAF